MSPTVRLFVLLLLIPAAVAAREPVRLAQGDRSGLLETGLEVYAGDGAASFETVSAPDAAFRPVGSLYPAAEGLPSTFWARVRLISTAPERSRWIVPFSLDEVTAILVRADGSRETYRTGRRVPLAERATALTDPPAVEIELEPGEGATLYLRVQHRLAGYDDPQPVRPTETRMFMEAQRRHDAYLFLFIGITVALAFYNFFLLGSFRDASYLYYVLFLVSSALHWATHEGYLTLFLWPRHSVTPHLEWSFFALVGAALAYTQFGRLFLRTRELAPRLDLALRAVLLTWMASGALALAGQWETGPTVAAVSALAMLVLTFWAGIQSHRRRFRPARYFLLAASSFILVGLGYTVAYLTGVEVHGFGRIALQTAMLVEMLLLAVALSVRIRILTTERTAALAAQERAEATTVALQEANDLKTRLLGIAAHDLRSPLTGIVGFSEVIEDETPERPDLHDLTATIRRGAMRMLGLIEDLLVTTALDGQRIELHREAVDLGAMVGDLAAEYDARVREKEQTLTVEVPAVAPFARVDPERFRAILDNLISNAVKYTPVGGYIRVRASVKNGAARVAISDSGPGLSPEDQAALFQRFRRLTPTPTGGESSSGLGLSIAHELAVLHGGRIEVASALGEGSTFTIVVPAETRAEARRVAVQNA